MMITRVTLGFDGLWSIYKATTSPKGKVIKAWTLMGCTMHKTTAYRIASHKGRRLFNPNTDKVRLSA